MPLSCFLKKIFFIFGFLFLPQGRLFPQLIEIGEIARRHSLKMMSQNSFGTRSANFSFKNASRVYRFNDISMPLGFPAVQTDGKIFIDQSDYKYHIQPLLPSIGHNYKKLKIIAVDAGHGGIDSGAISKINGLKEKDLTFKVGIKVAQLLHRDGYKVVLTRGVDKKIPLFDRTEIANRAGADLFISIHFNFAASKAANGIETFVLTPAAQSSTYDPASRNRSSLLPGNKFDNLNLLLGYHLQSSLVTELLAEDRGVKHLNFAVLKNLKCPGALVECGFLSNVAESNKFLSPKYIDKLAQSIFLGIKQFDKALSD